MSLRDTGILIALAAIWGASFLFMRVAVVEFGAAPLMEVRIVVGALCLLPVLLWRYRKSVNRALVKHMLVVGATNSALPFTLLAYATIYLSAGYTSLLNSTVPLWSAIIGAFWLNDALTRWQMLGIFLGFVGVFVLILGQGTLDFSGTTLAIIASLLATLSYAVSANYTKKNLQGVPAMVSSALSLVMASFLLLPFAWHAWPTTAISWASWGHGIALGVLCTAVAYLLFFGLIERIGATKSVSVTFLIPAFAVVWGWMFLDELLTLSMLAGCAIIFAGTALTLGLIAPQMREAISAVRDEGVL